MTRRTHSYKSEELTIEYDAKRCIHAEECVHGLPDVFDAARRPWIDPRAASPVEVIDVIQRCPTGALAYRWRDGREGEQPPDTTTVRVAANGPLYVHGRLRLAMPDGDILDDTRVALCRCGHSKDKPFCDNSHRDTGFAHDGEFAEPKLVEGEVEPGDVVEISFAKNGPILIRGALQVVSSSGTEAAGRSGALCRCGDAATKPFCDGTHKTAGFEAD